MFCKEITVILIINIIYLYYGCSGSMNMPQFNQPYPLNAQERTYIGYRLISPSDMAKLYKINVNNNEFEVALTKESKIRYIQTYSQDFVTDEGVKVGMTLEDVQNKVNLDVLTLPGWAFVIRFQSGWCAAFIVGDSMTEHFPDKKAEVKFLFKWK